MNDRPGFGAGGQPLPDGLGVYGPQLSLQRGPPPPKVAGLHAELGTAGGQAARGQALDAGLCGRSLFQDAQVCGRGKRHGSNDLEQPAEVVLALRHILCVGVCRPLLQCEAEVKAMGQSIFRKDQKGPF